MSKPWEISGDDLVAWADRVEAPPLLPALVRRLLLATASLRRIDMRADGGIRLAGWDGEVEVIDAPPFLPTGVSGWELSTSEDVYKKLNEDFDKRAHDPSPLDASRTSYVAVTARRASSKKSAWQMDRRAQRIFADVRLLDADDLATWIGMAPAVARWFAARLGRHVDALDVEQFLDAWSRRTYPHLPRDLALLGQDRVVAAESVREWLGRPPEDAPRLEVQADTREEALLFVSAVLASPQPERDTLLARSLIVETRETWRELADDPSLILLANFDEAAEEIARARGKSVLPLDPQTKRSSRPGLTLESVPYGRIAEALMSLGMTRDAADRMARDTGGRFRQLQRKLGYNAPPAWLRMSDERTLGAMLLLGAWEPDSEADQEAAGKLGVGWQELEAMCNRLLSAAERPILRDESRWRRAEFRWASLSDAWAAIGRLVPPSQIRDFQQLAIEILGSHDPQYGMPKAERMYAGIKGVTLRHSQVLREGVATSLVMLTVHDELLGDTLGLRRASLLSRSVVRELLAPEWQRWASLSDHLPMLAEAAPAEFIEAAEKSIQLGEQGISHLFTEEVEWGSSPHTGLLRALESLGFWHDLWRRAALALAKLAARDPGGKLADRPIASLGAMLRPWNPESGTTPEERVEMLRQLMQIEPAIGWKLAVDALPDVAGRILHSAHRPHHNIPPNLPARHREPSPDEYLRQIDRTVDLLLSMVGDDEERWLPLLDQAVRSEEHVELRILEALLQSRPHLSDKEGKIWAHLRDALHFGYRRTKQENPPPDPKRLEVLYRAFTPDDFVKSIAWLYAPFPQLPELLPDDMREEEAVVEKRRLEAIEELWRREDHREALEGLIRSLEKETPHYLGRSLAQSSFADQLEKVLLGGTDVSHYSPVVPMFLITRSEGREPSWIQSALRTLVEQGRPAEARETAYRMAQGAALWDFVDQLGDPLRNEFWTRFWMPLGRDLTLAEIEVAIARFLDLDNIAMALQTASWRSTTLAPHLALRVLEIVRTNPKGKELQQIRGSGFGHDIQRLFTALDRDPAIPTQRIIDLEIAFFPFLRESNRPMLLHRVLADSSEEFARLVAMRYSATKEDLRTPDSETAKERAQKVQFAYHLLDSWHGVPGNDLNGEAREARLLEWSREALKRTEAAGHRDVGIHAVARVLARAPVARDGLWPCRAARVLLEEASNREMRDGLDIAERNRRGSTMRAFGEGGTLERTEAQGYREAAEKLRAEWPKTAQLLDELAYAYEVEALDEDAAAKSDRLRWGLDRPTPKESGVAMKPSSTPAVSGLIRQVKIRNFRLLAELDVDLGPVNVFFGPNGSGKSSLLDAIRMIHDCFVRGVEQASSFRDHGVGLRHDRADEHAPISIELSVGGLKYELRLGLTAGRIEAAAGEWLFLRERSLPLVDRKIGNSTASFRSPSGASPTTITLDDTAELGLKRYLKEQPTVPDGAALAAALREVRFHHAHHFALLQLLRVGTQGSPTTRLEANGENLWSVLRNLHDKREADRRFDTIRRFMHRAFPHFDHVEIDQGGPTQVYGKFYYSDRRAPIFASGAADGEVSLLLLLTALFSEPDDRSCVILLDEPEIALHPWAIVVLSEAIKEAAERWNRQVFLATHSPVLIGQFEPAAVFVAERKEGVAHFERVADREDVKDLVEQYALGSLYMAELIGRQSRDEQEKESE